MAANIRKLIITVGLPGSGKSTWARTMVRAHAPGGVVRLNGDLLRAMMHDGVYAGDQTERQVVGVTRAAAAACFDAGARKVIIDATNLRASVLRDWFDLARDLHAQAIIHSFLGVPLQLCMSRNAERQGTDRVPDDRMRKMAELRSETARMIKLVEDGWEPFVSVREIG